MVKCTAQYSEQSSHLKTASFFQRTLPGFLVTLGFTYVLWSTVKAKSARHCSELHNDPPPSHATFTSGWVPGWALICEKVFADAGKFNELEMRSSRVWLGPKSKGRCPGKKGRREGTDTEETTW